MTTASTKAPSKRSASRRTPSTTNPAFSYNPLRPRVEREHRELEPVQLRRRERMIDREMRRLRAQAAIAAARAEQDPEVTRLVPAAGAIAAAEPNCGDRS